MRRPLSEADELEADELEAILGRLWSTRDEAISPLLPRTLADIAAFRERLRAHLDATPRRVAGSIDPAAIVRGQILASGPNSVIEAGAIIHDSCRLVLGAGSRVRSGAVLRDDVWIGPQSTVGVNCEVVRSVLLGPETVASHFVFVADSVIGARTVLSGYVAIANTPLRRGASVELRIGERRLDSGRTHLGLLAGDDVTLGACICVCPGCIVLPGLSLPPQAVLLGVVDEARRARLMADFFARWGAPG